MENRLTGRIRIINKTAGGDKFIRNLNLDLQAPLKNCTHQKNRDYMPFSYRIILDLKKDGAG